MHQPQRITALVAIAAASALVATGCSTATASTPPAAANVAYLWALGTTDATLVTGEGTSYLELDGVGEAVTRFSDRPDREASLEDLRDFLGRWEGRFSDDPPNAVLSYQVEDAAAPVQIVIEISRPRYDEEHARIVFAAELIDFTPDELDGADHPVEAAPPVVPPRTGPASLFIDSDGPDVTLDQVHELDENTAAYAESIDDLERLIRQRSQPESNWDQLIQDDLDALKVHNYRLAELDRAYIDVVRASRDKDRDSDHSVWGQLVIGKRPLALSSRTEATLTSLGIPLPKYGDRHHNELISAIRKEVDDARRTQSDFLSRIRNHEAVRDQTEWFKALEKAQRDGIDAMVRKITRDLEDATARS